MAGCASVPEDAQFSEVANQVENRSGMKTDWHVGLPQHSDIRKQIKNLLQKPLTATSAVQVALLNNPGLQAKYAELGIAQADLIQAGLLANPTFEGIFTFPEGGGKVNLEFDLIFDFLRLLTIPLRKAIAESEFEETQLKMIKFTIDLASQSRRAFYQAQASHQIKAISDQVVKSSKASFIAAKALRDAGNISALKLDIERSFYEQSKVDFIEVESKAYEARALLIRLIGLCEDDVNIQFYQKLPKPPLKEPLIENMSQTALQNSLELALIRQRIETLCRRYQITNFTALIPDFQLGGRSDRDDGIWKTGPLIEFALPIFDQGQPAQAKLMFKIRGLQEEYANMILQIRSLAQVLKQNISKARQRVSDLQNVMFPLQQKILNETQLHYNAMQVGVFDLLRAKQNQLEMEHKYIEALLSYWLTRSTIEQLINGSLPAEPNQYLTQIKMNSTQGDDRKID